MTYDEMNRFILNYVKNDITGRAIMLTGDWGSGKSYYVKNTLKPFLEDNNNGNHKCVIVSLYGLTDVSQISKAIYIETKWDSIIEHSPKIITGRIEKAKDTKSEMRTTFNTVSKTILKGITSYFGVDLSADEESLKNLYQSVNLSNYLIILEDFERSGIDRIQLLGYVNNMTEQDGVKILLVTNESELLDYNIEEVKKTDYSGKKSEYKKVYSENALKYFKAKEKSVSDTLQFHADLQETIDSIIDRFKNDDLSSFKGVITQSNHSYVWTEITNYREVLVACQKACDIYNYMNANSITADREFKKCILIGLVNYLQKHLDEPNLKFKENSVLDADLSGDIIYPLMRFCYDYYHSQIITQEAIIQSIEEYKDYLIYVDKTGYDDKDLKVLYALFVTTEKELNTAIQNIYDRLDDVSDISLRHYDRIINCLLILKYDALLSNDKIDGIIKKIIDNLKGRGTKFNKTHHLFSSTLTIQDANGAKEFVDIQNKVFESLDYTPDSITTTDPLNYAEIITKISSDSIRQYNPNMVMEKIPLDSIIEHIPEFSAETLDNLRHILLAIDYNELYEDTLSLIKDFKDKILLLLQSEDTGLDCIKRLQLRWTCDAIERNIATMSK